MCRIIKFRVHDKVNNEELQRIGMFGCARSGVATGAEIRIGVTSPLLSLSYKYLRKMYLLQKPQKQRYCILILIMGVY